MKRMRWFLICVAILFTLAVLFILIERLRGQVGVRALMQDLVVRGEKLTVQELIRPKIANDANAAVDLIEAASQLNDRPGTPGEVPPSMKFIEPSKVAVVAHLQSWESKDSDGKLVTNSWSDVERNVADSRSSITLIVEALRKTGFDSGVVLTNGFDNIQFPGLKEVRTATRWLSAACLVDLHNGNADQALSTLTAINSLISSLQNEPLMISQLRLERLTEAEHVIP
jgi:hypothetical protein